MKPAAILLVAVACGALSTASAAAPGPPPSDLSPQPWYVLTQEGGGMGRFTDDVVVFSKVRGGRATFWIAERVRSEKYVGLKPPEVTRQWIDGRRCPALAGVLARGVATPVRAMAPPTTTEESGGVSDTPVTRLSGPASGTGNPGARVSRSDYMGPLARWWRESDKALQACWTVNPVADGPARIRPQLATPEGVRFMKAF